MECRPGAIRLSPARVSCYEIFKVYEVGARSDDTSV